MLEPKKLALIRILQILKFYSDNNHPLKQEKIAEILQREYGIEVERKAIGRNLSLLKEAGYEIISTRAGSYLDERAFEDAELKLLIDGVLCSKHISPHHSKDLIEKLAKLSNVYFKSHIKNIYSVNDWNKTQNCDLFLNIELADEAIEKGKQIAFTYNKFGEDKKLHKSARHSASPYQMILHNQHYYLIALNEKWKNMGYYRMDKITDIQITDLPLTPIRTVEGYENGIDYKRFSSSLPYMFTDEPEQIELLANRIIIDQIVDWFGYDIRIQSEGEKAHVTLTSSPNAMAYWALQYIEHIEVLSPLSLREKIHFILQSSIKKYE